MLEDEDEDDEDIGPDVSQFTTWSAVQLGVYGKRHFQLKEDTVSKLVTENVTGASIACLQEQDLSDLKIAKPVSATWCPVRHFLLILFQKPFCNCLSAGLTSKGGKKAAAGAPRKKADDNGGVTGFNSLPKEEKDYLKLLYASHFPVETFPGATSVSEQDLSLTFKQAASI